MLPWLWMARFNHHTVRLADTLRGGRYIDAELMVAMYETPELVAELFDRTTMAIIDLIEAAQGWRGDSSLCILNNHMFHSGSGRILTGRGSAW